MASHSWIRRVFSPTPRTSRKGRARVRPAVECLEDRLVPASITVSTLADPGPSNFDNLGLYENEMTLRDAIMLANAGSLHNLGLAMELPGWIGDITPGLPYDMIIIPSSLYVPGENVLTGVPFSTIQLNGTQLPTITGQFTIVGDQTLNGFFAPVWYISGEHNSRVFQVGPTGNLTLDNLTIENGAATGSGGGILNQGTLTLENVTLTANRAASGGGIASTGPALTMDHSIITGNQASVSGGGVYTSSPAATFTHDQITNNNAAGADHSADSPSTTPKNGGSVEGGGIDITGGNVSISFSTISGNAAQGGGGGPGNNGPSFTGITNAAAYGQNGAAGTPGGNGTLGGSGGQAQGGGIWLGGGALSITNSTLSNNTAQGGLGAAGGNGGNGASGQAGGPAPPAGQNGFGVIGGGNGGAGGAGGNGANGGAGGAAQGGGLFVALAVTNLSLTNTTVAGNQATGGQGGRSGAGGTGGNGGNGGTGGTGGIGTGPGAGGVGGAGGSGATTGAPGSADGAGIHFDPSSNPRQIASSTIAYNNVSAGADAAIGLKGPGGQGGLSGDGGTPASNGVPGHDGTLGAAGLADGGGLYGNGGVGLFNLTLTNSIVAANNKKNASTTLTFDGGGGPPAPVMLSGFQISLSSGGFLANSVPNSPLCIGTPGARATLTRTDGTPFGLTSIIIYSGDPNQIIVFTGTLFGGGTTTTFINHSGAVPTGVFAGPFPNAFADVVSVSWAQGTPGVNSYQFNNLVVTTAASDIYGTLALPGLSFANLIGDGGAGGLVNGTFQNKVGVSAPGLLPLGSYGGETQTIALKTNSPAVDAGNSSLAFGSPDSPLSVLADPGFETPSVATQPNHFEYRPTGSPWSFAGQAGLASNGSAFNNTTAPAGSQVAFLQMSGSSISQTVNLAAGTYSLSFQTAQRPGNQQTFQVLVDGAAVATVTPAGSQFAPYVTGPFTVTAGSHMIQFVGVNPLGGDNTAFLDQIQMSIAQPLTTDQRGFARISGGTVDIGAFELQQSFVVTTLQDNENDDAGIGTSLRGAIEMANTKSTPQTITFTPGLTGTITLTLGDLHVNNSMTIAGPGANLLSISGNNASRVFAIDKSLSSSTISGLSIINGSAIYGGGIRNRGSLTLDHVVLSHNTAHSAPLARYNGYGAGIFSFNSLTITGSTISDNDAAWQGGGINMNHSSSLTLVNSTITGNSASHDGGGIFGAYNGSAVLTNDTVASNTAAPGSGSGFWGQFGNNGTRFDLTLKNTIIADGLNGGVKSGLEDLNLTIQGTNLVENLTNVGGVINSDPHLGPLQDNGGPTPTMALLPGSPAVDAGVNSFAVDASGNPLQTDQNGFSRISGANVDLGAYEVQPASLSTPANGQQATQYHQTITATQPGYQTSWGTFTFAVTHGTLPPGLSLSQGGVLSGIPTTAGTFTFTVTASDLAGFGSQQYSVTISPAPSPVVDTLADNFDYNYSAGHLSLREALYIAQLPGVAPVTFAPGLHGTIALTGGPLAITSSVTIQGPGANVLTVDAGGQSRVFSVTGGVGVTVSISGLTISGGSAATGGGIWNADTLKLSNVVVTHNSGGGIENDQGNLYLMDSTVSGNTTATAGGGIDMPAGGALTAVNSTIADNTAIDGGGIYSSGYLAIFGGQGLAATVTLTNVTVAGNSASLGAGVFNGQTSTLTLANTIIGEDTGSELSQGQGSVAFGSIIAVHGQNLVQGGLAGFPTVLSADPLLGPLQNNGGPTPTMALLPGSQALDAGDNGAAVDASGSSLTTDQRGLPRVHGTAVDLGAFEVYGPAVVDTLADTSNGDYSPGHFSLREAVLIGASPITFAPGLQGTITLSQGPLVITGGATIQGPGANVLTIDGNGHSSVFHIAGAHAAYPPPITTSISGLTITNASNGIVNTSDTLSLSDVVVTGNSTAGIDNEQAVLHVVNSTISSNGSGIVDVDGQVTLVGSTVANNIGGDANGNGGGISVVGTGGIMEATLTAVNTTIADNAALLEGGGIYASGTLGFFVAPVQVTLTNVTVAGNDATYGAGIFNSTGSTLTLYNTILGANNGSDLTNDVTDEFLGGNGFTMALGANLVQSVDALNGLFSQAAGGEFQANPAVISADPLLGPLQDNGGPTQTMALLPGSPALDAGGNSLVPAGVTTDQRGYARVSGAAVDLGAYEVQPLSITTATLAGGTYASPYKEAIAASEAGVSSFTFSLSGGSLPPGLTLASDGTLSGTPSAVGTFSFTVQAQDSYGTTASQAYTVAVAPALLTIMPSAGVTKVYGAPLPTLPFTVILTAFESFPVFFGALGTTATPSSPVGNYAITLGNLSVDSNYTLALEANPPTLVVTPAVVTVSVHNASRIYGVANPSFTVSYSGLVNGDSLRVISGHPAVTTTAMPTSPPGQYPITVGLGTLTAANYTFALVNGTLTVKPAPLHATAMAVSAMAGAPFSGPVASFTNADPFGSAASYSATITWGDGHTSAGVITAGSGNTLIVSGTHTYADPATKTMQVRITHKLGYTTTATVYPTATITSLGQTVQPGVTGTIAFWDSAAGQTLIDSFNGDSTATALSAWLAATFPNLYGATAGSSNLTGETNAQIAALFASLYGLAAPQPGAEILSEALNIYASTSSLGGNAGSADGFQVSATGLGALSFNVGSVGAPFGVANNTMRNVYELLVAVNNRAVKGVPYNGSKLYQQEVANLFAALNQAGEI